MCSSDLWAKVISFRELMIRTQMANRELQTLKVKVFMKMFLTAEGGGCLKNALCLRRVKNRFTGLKC